MTDLPEPPLPKQYIIRAERVRKTKTWTDVATWDMQGDILKFVTNDGTYHGISLTRFDTVTITPVHTTV